MKKTLILFGLLSLATPPLLHAQSTDDPAEIGRRLAKRFLGNIKRVDEYPTVCSAYGIIQWTEATGSQEFLGELKTLLEPFASGVKTTRVGHVDFNVFGAWPLALSRLVKDERYQKLGLSLADAQFAQTKVDEKTGKDSGLTYQTRTWVDDLYMIGALQCNAYRVTKDIRYIDRAALQFASYIPQLQQPNGLYRHGLDSPYLWSRGNGWVAASLTELLKVMPADHPQRPFILDTYRKMMAGLVKCQDATGRWHQLLDKPDSFLETSGTGMFVFALTTGVRNSWLTGAEYREAALRGWKGLTDRIDADGTVKDVCRGTNQKNDLTFYLTRPKVDGDAHGQAAALWAASAMIGLDNDRFRRQNHETPTR